MTTSAATAVPDILTRAQEMFMRVGIRSVSMDDIARELGRSKKTLYQFFPNKDVLVNRIMEQYLRSDQALLLDFRKTSSDAIEEWYKILNHNCRFLSSMNPYVIFDLRKYHAEAWNMFVDYKHNVIRKAVRDNLKRGKREGLYRADMDENILSGIYVLKIEVLVDGALFPGVSREDVLKEYIAYHLRGIASTKGLHRLDRKHKLS